ncbi:hypothetical protein Tco_1401421 [Tanacetum coccineum]
MAHNHYLEEARKKIQERNRNSKPSVMPSVRLQNTANGSTPNPKRTNQTSRSLPTSKSSCVTIMVVPKADHSRNSSSFSDSKHFFCSTCHKCVFNANHDACITKLLNEVNSRKVKPHKTKNSNNPVEQKSHTQKPGRQIFSGHRFSPKKTSAVYEKTSPRSCLRWKPTGKIFTTVGLKWIPTGKLFDSCTSKVDSEPPNGSNDDITNPYECDQTLNVSAGILNLSADNTSGLAPQRKEKCTIQCALSSKEEKSSWGRSRCIPDSVLGLLLRVAPNFNHMGKETSHHQSISGLYTSRLLDAACKKILNLLKKGLLKVEAVSKSAWTEKDQIDNFLKERMLMRSLEKFMGGRLYEGDLRLRQKNHMILSYDVLIIQDKTIKIYTSAGNPVKQILLKLNLPDHRKLKDGGEGAALS